MWNYRIQKQIVVDRQLYQMFVISMNLMWINVSQCALTYGENSNSMSWHSKIIQKTAEDIFKKIGQ